MGPLLAACLLCLTLRTQSTADSLTRELALHYEASGLPGFAVAVVNAEDSETLYAQYRKIHDILANYEDRL